MAYDDLVSVCMRLYARNCCNTARDLHTTPDALGLYVDQEYPQGPWHIRARHHPTTALPSGRGILAWDTERFPDVETAFHAALVAVWPSVQPQR
jgi:hypothetical protein